MYVPAFGCGQGHVLARTRVNMCVSVCFEDVVAAGGETKIIRITMTV